MLVRKARSLPVECIVRGYLSGSGLKEYRASGAVSGIKLPSGLTEASRLPEPIFTPSTKAEIGEHDVNIDFATVVRLVGQDVADKKQQRRDDEYSEHDRVVARNERLIAE